MLAEFVRHFGPYVLWTMLDGAGKSERHLATRRDAPAPEVLVLERFVDAAIPPFVVHEFVRHEGPAARGVRHDVVLPLLDFGVAEDTPFAVWPYLAGITLARCSVSRPALGPFLQTPLLAWLGAQLAEGLAAVHQHRTPAGGPAGLVHGHLSARTIGLTVDGAPRILGLGTGALRRSMDDPEGGALSAQEAAADVRELGVALKTLAGGDPRWLGDDAVRAADGAVPGMGGRGRPSRTGDLGSDDAWTRCLADMTSPESSARPTMVEAASRLAAIGAEAAILGGALASAGRAALHQVFEGAFSAARARASAVLEAANGAAPVTTTGVASWSPPPSPAPAGLPPRASPEESTKTVPSTVGRYVVRARASTGAATQHGLAWDPNLHREVFWKRLVSDRDEDVRCFKRAARMQAELSSPRIPRLYDAGRDAIGHYLVTEWCAAQPLSRVGDRIRQRPASARVAMATDLLAALAHVHGRGIIHGDLRAPNYLVDAAGRGWLVDFSLSFCESPPERFARNRIVHAPEYRSSGRYDVRSEQFALGLLLYELFSGARPDLETVFRQRAVLPLAARPGAAGLAPVWCEMVDRMLAWRPEERFESVQAAMDWVGAGLDGTLLSGGRGQSQHSALSDGPAVPAPSVPAAPALSGSVAPVGPGASARPASSLDVVHSAPPGNGVDRAEVVLLDAELDASVVETFALGGVAVSVLRDRAALRACLREAPPKVVVVGPGARNEWPSLRREIEALAPDVDAWLGPPHLARLLGPPLATGALVSALVRLLEQASALDGWGGVSVEAFVPSEAAADLARQLGLGPRAAYLAPIAVAALRFARRMGWAMTQVSAWVPTDAARLMEASEGIAPGAPAARLSQLVALVSRYARLTEPLEGVRRASPRRAVACTKTFAQDRIDPDIVTAFLRYLEARISGLDVETPLAAAPRVLWLAPHMVDRVVPQMAEEGFFVEHVPSARAAVDRLRAVPVRGLVIDEQEAPSLSAGLLARLPVAKWPPTVIRLHAEGGEVTEPAKLPHVVTRPGTSGVQGLCRAIGDLVAQHSVLP